MSSLMLFSHGDRAHNSSHHFTENLGQWNKVVMFKSEMNGATIYFEKNAFHYQLIQNQSAHAGTLREGEKTTKNQELKGHNFKAIFLNSNQNVSHSKEGPSTASYNFFLGNNKEHWRSGVRKYKEITYNELYNGIDLVSYTKSGFLKYDYLISPNTDPSQIRVQYKGVKKPLIREGNLIIAHSLGELIEEKPYAYQIIEGEKKEIKCLYQIDKKGIVSFSFPEGYNVDKTLIIDPTLVFATFSGSDVSNFGMTATYDDLGNGYLGGTVFGNGYDTTLGAFQTSFGGGRTDVTISKFNSDGSQLIYGTYIGGNGSESVHSMVVGPDSTLTVFGATSSTDFPLSANAFDNTKPSSAGINLRAGYNQDFANGSDIFITKFSIKGDSLIGSTYFGGDDNDGLNIDPNNLPTFDPVSGNSTNFLAGLTYNYGDHFRGEIVLDSLGFIYIGASTASDNLPSAKNNHSGLLDGVVAKFNSDLSQLEWCRYLGGNDLDAIYSLKIINGGKILVGGGTRSFADFPATNNSYQDTSLMGETDGFISIISADGNTLEKSTFIGTDDYDQVYFIEFDRNNKVYAFGQTTGEFPIVNSTFADTATGQFIIKLDANLDSLEYAHTFGDNGRRIPGTGAIRLNISPTAFLVDQCQNIFASGWGGDLNPTPDGDKFLSLNMDITSDAEQSTTDNNDFYLYTISALKDELVYATFFGSNQSQEHVDGGTSRFDKKGVIYQSVCAACSGGTRDFPTSSGAYAETIIQGTQCNNALFKLNFEVSIDAEFILSEDEFCLSNNSQDSVVITNNSSNSDVTTWDFNGDTIVSNFKDTTIYITSPGVYEIQQIVFDSICAIGDFKTLRITARPDNIILTSTRDTAVCYEDSTEIKVFSKGFANLFTWSESPDFSNPLPFTDSIIKAPLVEGVNTFYVLAENTITNACPKADTIIVEYLPVEFNVTLAADTACENSLVELSSSQLNVDKFKWDFANGTTDSISQDTSIVYTVGGDYLISIEYENSLCNAKDTVYLSVNVQSNDLLFENLIDTLFCGDGNFRVSKNTFGTAEQFIWSTSPSLSDTINSSLSDSTFTINQNDSSLYFIQISDKYCTRLDSILAQYIEYRVNLDAIVDQACTPFTQELGTEIIGTDSFRIDFGNNNFTTSDSTPIVNYTNSGIYTIQLIGSNARCNLRDTLTETIEIFQNVELIPLIDTIVCAGDQLSLKGNSSGTAQQFFWDTSPNFPSPINLPTDSVIVINPSQTTTYYLRGRNVICETDDTVTVTVEVVDVEIENVVSLCLEDTINIEATVITAPPSLTYLWSPNDSIHSGQGTPSITISPVNDMKVSLISTSNLGCQDFDTIDVNVNFPEFTDAQIFISRDSIFKGEVTQLSTNRNGSNLVYKWEPIEGMDDPTSPNPNLTVGDSKEYKVTITDLTTGCVVVETRSLFVFEVNCAEPDIFIPTAFTPNSDLNNDILYVRGANLRSIDFQLFNRWGELVFETKDKNSGWDGVYKGMEVDPGVFAYQLRATCFDGQEYYSKGNITLIR